MGVRAFCPVQFGETISAMTANNTKGQPVGNLTRWVYFLAALIIALATASLVFVGLTASREADRHALENEKRLFENALREHHVGMAQEQLALAQWDKSVQNIDLAFNPDFVEDEFVEYLWHDYELERTFLIGPDDVVLADAFRGRIQFDQRTLAPNELLGVTAEAARKRFMKNRIRIEGGFAQTPVKPRHVSEVSTYAFASLDGRPALLSAMAIVPDDGTVALKDRSPVILVNARYIDGSFLADLNAQLSLADLSFSTRVPEHPRPTDWLLTDMTGKSFGVFTWDGLKPGRDIWAMVVPLIVVLGGLLAAAAYTIARKIGKLSASLEESEKRHRHNAMHDPLTGLANRHRFSECVNEALADLPVQDFALIACDLDRFKAVNDTHGHAAGDAVICAVARRLSETVGADGTVGRIGGDEFVILMRRHTTSADLISLSRSVLRAIQSPIDIGDGQSANVGISLGIARAPECGSCERDLFAAADQALYAAKDGGRNTAVFAETGQEPSEKADKIAMGSAA
jgi:diguanylate cyclase (GGDEF)-like protein